MADPTTQGAPAAPAAPAPGTPEHDAAMAAKFDAAQGTPPATPATPPAQEPTPILGKFKTQDDLVKAYQELEKKLGAPAPAATPPATPPVPPPAADDKSKLTVEQTPEQKAAAEATAKAGVDYAALNAEFATKGALSPETYAKLEAGGIPKDMVDGYIAGQQALAAQAATRYDSAAFEQAGGEAKYTEMVTWAKGALSPAEATAFNTSVSSGDETKMRLAVANLRTKFETSFGAAPAAQLNGQASAGTQAYDSMAQMKADMRNPMYKSDPAFRAKVEARIAASDNLYTAQSRT